MLRTFKEFCVVAAICAAGIGFSVDAAASDSGAAIALPAPRTDSAVSIERAIHGRRSVRALSDAPITLAELGQLLWAAQGITSRRGLRAAPSAGALYPLEVYVLTGNVRGLGRAIYRYRPDAHALIPWRDGDRRGALARAALGQPWVARNAAVLAFSAVVARTQIKYGKRARRYVLIEVGHAAQNVLLQAQSLSLAAGVVGAFRDKEVDALLELPRGEHALYIVPIGKPID